MGLLDFATQKDPLSLILSPLTLLDTLRLSASCKGLNENEAIKKAIEEKTDQLADKVFSVDLSELFSQFQNEKRWRFLTTLCSKVSSEERRVALSSLEDKKNFSLFRVSVNTQKSVAAEKLLTGLSQKGQLTLLEAEDEDRVTPLTVAIKYGTSALIKALFKSLSIENRIALLKKQDRHGYSALHWAAILGTPEKIKALLLDIPEKSRLELLSLQDTQKNSPLHLAIGEERWNNVETFLGSIQKKNKPHILALSNNYHLSVQNLAKRKMMPLTPESPKKVKLK